MAEDIDTEVSKEHFGQPAACYPRSRFSCTRTFENVPGIRMVIFERSGEIRVTRTRASDSTFGSSVARHLAGGHDFLPIGPVAILDHHGDRTADSLPVPHAGEKTDLIFLDFHPAATAVPALAPFQFVIDKLEVDGKVCRNALYNCDQRWTVRLAGRPKAQHPLSIAEFSATMATMALSPKAAVKEVQDLSFLTARAFASIFRRPFYVRDILLQMDMIGVGSLTVVMLTGFFTGAVLTLQTSFQLSRFGAVGFTGGLVSVSLVRELGPVLAALMVAGRVGSGMASELGSMLVTEQINAMRALGTDPIKKLVVPRVLATIAMMPVLTIVADTLGIIGGLVVALRFLHITANLYLSRAWDSLDYMDLFGGLLKPLVFGALVAVVSCYCGLRTYGGTQGVGRSTTQAVVASSVLILVSDFFLTRLILVYTR
jgi:phospholipid/cholesterol/gamma-HCH transport system permease protein